MSEIIKLHIVEDHKIVRDGIRAMLLGVKDVKLSGESTNGQSFVDDLDEISVDIVILDIGLPDISGINIAEIISKKNPKLKVIILSANADEANINSAVNFGVAGFLSKDASKEEFLEAVRTVHSGEQFFSDSISKILYESYINVIKEKQAPDKRSLTTRETEVIKLISDGYSYKEIAKKLNISARTVETHRNNILEKLELKNNIEIVKYAIKSNIVGI